MLKEYHISFHSLIIATMELSPLFSEILVQVFQWFVNYDYTMHFSKERNYKICTSYTVKFGRLFPHNCEIDFKFLKILQNKTKSSHKL